MQMLSTVTFSTFPCVFVNRQKLTAMYDKITDTHTSLRLLSNMPHAGLKNVGHGNHSQSVDQHRLQRSVIGQFLEELV